MELSEENFGKEREQNQLRLEVVRKEIPAVQQLITQKQAEYQGYKDMEPLLESQEKQAEVSLRSLLANGQDVDSRLKFLTDRIDSIGQEILVLEHETSFGIGKIFRTKKHQEKETQLKELLLEKEKLEEEYINLKRVA